MSIAAGGRIGIAGAGALAAAVGTQVPFGGGVRIVVTGLAVVGAAAIGRVDAVGAVGSFAAAEVEAVESLAAAEGETGESVAAAKAGAAESVVAKVAAAA